MDFAKLGQAASTTAAAAASRVSAVTTAITCCRNWTLHGNTSKVKNLPITFEGIQPLKSIDASFTVVRIAWTLSSLLLLLEAEPGCMPLGPPVQKTSNNLSIFAFFFFFAFFFSFFSFLASICSTATQPLMGQRLTTQLFQVTQTSYARIYLSRHGCKLQVPSFLSCCFFCLSSPSSPLAACTRTTNCKNLGRHKFDQIRQARLWSCPVTFDDQARRHAVFCSPSSSFSLLCRSFLRSPVFSQQPTLPCASIQRNSSSE